MVTKFSESSPVLPAASINTSKYLTDINQVLYIVLTWNYKFNLKTKEGRGPVRVLRFHYLLNDPFLILIKLVSSQIVLRHSSSHEHKMGLGEGRGWVSECGRLWNLINFDISQRGSLRYISLRVEVLYSDTANIP